MEMLTKKMLGDTDVAKAEEPKYDYSDENLTKLPPRALESYLAKKYGTDRYVRERSSVFEEASKNKISDRESILTGPELEALSLIFEKQIKQMKNKAKGGVAEQMELFAEGGLKDEGNTVDPVSGNEVPPGATQEEVRDDIPAQLSEGEFVFPADVVRYIGLEKLMNLRQEAKAGLARMEAMGQMGNADEATLPDDIPFTLDDLDTREETEDDVIKANIGTFVPPRFNTGQPYNPNVNPYQATGVVPTVYAPATGAGLLGASAQGAPETENRRYVNKETGQVRMIPFVKATGQSLYPIPEGFVAEAETVKEEQPKQKTAKVQTAKVQDISSGDDGDTDKFSTLGGARMDVGGREFAVGYNFDGSITLTDPKTMESKTYSKDSQINKDIKAVTTNSMVELAKISPSGLGATLVNRGLEKIGVTLPGNTKLDEIKKESEIAKNRLDKTFVGISEDPTEGLNLEDLTSIQAGLEKGVDLTKKTDISNVTPSTDSYVSGDDLGSSAGAVGSGGDLGPQDDPGGSAGEVGGGSGYSDESLGGIFKQGGLAKKKKTKVKKMKRGGLASKK